MAVGERTAHFLIRYRWQYIILCGMITVLAIIGSTRMEFRTSFSDLLQQFVTTDHIAGSNLRKPVRFLGRARFRGVGGQSVQETACLVVGVKQRFYFRSQGRVAATGFLQKRCSSVLG